VVSAREHSRHARFRAWFIPVCVCEGGGGDSGPGLSVVGVGKFYGRLVLERTSKITFGKKVWLSFNWLLAIDSV
jgi:hypothetical protein